MPDDSPGFFRNLSSFANAYLQTKTRKLQNAKPQTKVDSGGSQNRVSFAGQDISRSDLKDIKEIRESGGIITSAYDAKALMRFGTGVEFHAENDELKEWLRSNLPNIDLTVLEMGEDATYYPYYVGESVKNRVGGFSHIEHIEPWTMLPVTDEYGDIIGWEQELSGTRETEQFTAEEIGHIVLNKSSGRDKTGISDVLQNKEEIETFRANQQAMRRATERLGYPFVHAKAGREGAAQLNDNELRRIRNRLADIGPGETQVTGPDVDIELKEGGTVDFGAIQERDTRMLSTAIGIPLELLNEGSDGLGSGKPAEARLDMFALQNEAARRRFAAQFKSEFLVDIVREYSPFDHTQEFGIHIKPFLDDKTDVAELIQKVGDYMTANEVRSRLDMEPLEDDEKGEGFQTPADEEAPEDEGGGLFGSAPSDTDFRNLMRRLETPQGVPSNAQGPVSDRSEVPDGAATYEGPRGGTYFVPEDVEPEGGSDADLDDIDNAEVVEEFAGKSFKRFGDFDDPTEAEPGVPIVTESPTGEREAGVLVDIREEASGVVAVYQQANGEFMFAGGSEMRDIVGLADRAEMGDEELRQYAQNRVEVGPEFEDIPDETRERVVETVQSGILSNTIDTDVAVGLAEDVQSIVDDVDRAYHGGREGGYELGFSENSAESTIHHEMGHAFHSTQGYMAGSGVNEVAHENAFGAVPKFGDEWRFGDNIPEFNEFLLSDEDGNTPGERQATIERAVANADLDDFVAQETPDDEVERVEEALNLERGDTAVFEVKGERVVGRVSGVEDAFIGDQQIQFEVLVDEDGNTPEETQLNGIKTRTDVRDTPEFHMSDNFVGRVDKEATANNTDFDIPQPRGGSGEQSPEEKFFGEVNRRWAESAGHAEAGRDYTAEHTSIKSGYSVNNTHETTARAVEALQNGDENAIEDMAQNQPEMLGALLEMMDAPEGLDELLAELGIGG